jgi:hypothetical protein
LASLVDGELMAQRNNLQLKCESPAERGNEAIYQCNAEYSHGSVEWVDSVPRSQADVRRASATERLRRSDGKFSPNQCVRIFGTHTRSEPGGSVLESDYQRIDVNHVELARPRSVAIEHVGLEALRQLGLDTKLAPLGLNAAQRAAAIGTIIAIMAAPGSELFTHGWLGKHSALGELIDYDFERMRLMQLNRISGH